MKLIIDTETQTLELIEGLQQRTIPLYSDEAFETVSQQWSKIGWNQKYTYTFTWMGRPVIQLPEDMLRMQEAIYQIKPDVIVETGVAHGGSLIYYASLFKSMSKGRVIGIDIEIRPHNRAAIEEHELFPFIELVEGSSTASNIVKQVKSMVSPDETVMVILDSDHSRQHVLDELNAYHDLVTPGSYIVATDGVMQEVYDVPRGNSAWQKDNPAEAAKEFLGEHPEFKLEEPAWSFNESSLDKSITHWPDAWLYRKNDAEMG